ncbi:hypothetical protein [Kribbella deserti]|uniref:MarR family transcriptional regulator n=1 Tax=Kribbella deserti TaxID=1926257 RepID=A0ABV6QY07_9ACTN
MVLVISSVFFVTAAIGDIATGASDTDSSTLWGILVFFLSASAVGGWMAWANLGPRRRQVSQQELELKVLDLARELGGSVTVVEVASDCGVSVSVAKQALDRLCGHGVATPELTDAGLMVYRVDFLPPPALP